MISGEAALRKILFSARPTPAETVPAALAAGRVLAEIVRVREDMPAFDNSTVDGFAVRVPDLAEVLKGRFAQLRLQGPIRAGRAARVPVRPGHAVPIMTGAPVPLGAGAVVMKERTALIGGGFVRVFHAPRRGEWIRRRGEDARAGAVLIRAGTRVRAYEASALAAQGIASVRAYARPLAAVLSTGDELIEGSKPLGPGQIRDSNRPAILSALRLLEIPALDLGVAPDVSRAIEAKLRRALKRADVVIVSGGVSVGEYDLVKPLLAKLGVRRVFWRVRIKPGMPFFFGVYGRGRGKPVFGLPGNPISSLVCFEEFVRPALEKMQGLRRSPPPFPCAGRALNAFDLPARRQYLFCSAGRSGGGFRLRILRPQASHRIATACRANALALAPSGAARIKRGDVLEFRWL